MIPRFSFAPNPDLPEEAAFWMPPAGADDEEEALGYFHDTWAISDITIDLALTVLSAELQFAGLVDRSARDPHEFEVLASAVEWPSSEYAEQAEFAHVGSDLMAEITDEVPSELEGLELGVAGLVHALAVHGCVPAASCRGHFRKPSEPQWSQRPVVFVAANRELADQLVPLVQASGCGFTFDDSRPKLIVIEAPSIAESTRLAEEILCSITLGISVEQRAQLSEARLGRPGPNQGTLW